MEWARAWTAIILIWSVVGIAGLVLSIATLRVARAKLKMVPANRPLLRSAATQVVRSAWSRIAVFSFLAVNGPLVYRMFDITAEAGIGDRIEVAAPLGIVFISGTVLTISGIVALCLLIADTKELLR